MVRKVERKRYGTGWEVRYTQGGHKKSKTFDLERDALDFEAEVRRRKRLGTLSYLEAGEQLLDDFIVDWWKSFAKPNLKASTRRRYLEVWRAHLQPRIGQLELRAITPSLVEDLRVQLEGAGVGQPTIRKALFLLQAVMRQAVVREKVPSNPVREIRKPLQRSRRPQPIAPLAVERLCAELGRRDAMLCELIAYGGCRPFEALRLADEHVAKRTFSIYANKTERERIVKMLAPLATDLAEYRLASRRPAGLLFPRPSDGDEWSEGDYRNWRRRIFKPAAAAAGLPDDARPYDLRHTFVSLLIQEGQSVAYVAEQAGHSKEECYRTYMHLFEDYDASERLAAEEAIRRAREQLADERSRLQLFDPEGRETDGSSGAAVLR